MNKPNIVLILTDHFRRDALRPDLTPNLMKLARQGTQFVNAYSASPLCQPARNCIITGMHAGDNGITGNQQPPLPEDLRADTFMRKLQSAGYYTAMVGKHHYIDRYGIGVDVTADNEDVKAYGFDRVFQVVDDGENAHNQDEYTKWLDSQGRLEEFRDTLGGSNAPAAANSGGHPYPPDDTADGFIGVNGIRFVEQYHEDKPFYLNLSFIGPHPPFWHPGNTRDHLADGMPVKGAEDSPALRQMRNKYLEKCALIDSYVGRLLQALEDKGALDNTVIIFTGDHGDMLGNHGIWDKRYFYEESVGIPLFMSGGSVPAEQRMCGTRLSKSLVSHLDLYPTILDLAGVSRERHRKRPGKSLLRVLSEEVSGHDHVIAELATAMMIRTANWKLVYDPESGGVQQLFNLVRDPEELNNLSGVPGYESVTADLIEKLLANKIRRSQITQAKEEQRLQRVHVA
ncbi:MAG: sulfatase-like hydrolase/transferase [Candidatus Pacebacteria bacterium]|nr:sulfatase-like hydrolase/transferase [Candidatus Paceibacterota bacterium]